MYDVLICIDITHGTRSKFSDRVTGTSTILIPETWKQQSMFYSVQVSGTFQTNLVPECMIDNQSF